MRFLLCYMLMFFVLNGLKAETLSVPEAPANLTYCGMQLHLTIEARIKVQRMINRLYKKPEYFQLLLDRCDTYMPFIEDAIERFDVPEDLKYIAILESALVGDAVSVSNAVGFWQFKDFTAREMGLIVNDQVDERKHIVRSSNAAMRYFSLLNRDFDNWVYSIIGYNQGGRGAIPYTNAKLYGKNSMTVSGDLHPYAIKAIAHKLAFEELLGKNISPKIKLELYATLGETSIVNLANQNNIDINTFKDFNLWISKPLLPRNTPFTYFIPKESETKNMLEEENEIITSPIVQTENTSLNLPEQKLPKEKTNTEIYSISADPELVLRSHNIFTLISCEKDPDYGKEYVYLQAEENISDIAKTYKKGILKLIEWNGLYIDGRPSAGTLIHLKAPNRVKIHLVQAGETTGQIARKYKTTVTSIKKRNHMGYANNLLHKGQKLYLRKTKPVNEKVVVVESWSRVKHEEIIALENGQEKVIAEATIGYKKVTKAHLQEMNLAVEKVNNNFTTHTEYHKVMAGETLWAISKKYNTKVGIIKKMNSLESDKLMPGQQLKVLVKTE